MGAPSSVDVAARNPVHCGGCPPHVAWSTINAGEALPGVVTPLTWSLYGDGVERAMRGAFCDLGVLRQSEVTASPRPEDRLWDLFYGRSAANLNTFRSLADRMPGTNGDAIEEQIFGQVRPGVTNEPTYRRYPAFAAKAPVAAARVAARLRAATADIDPWWRHSVGGEQRLGRAGAQALAAEAARRFEDVMRPHTLAALLCQALYEQVRVLAERAGKPGLELSLVTGYGDMAETEVVADLWDVSRDRLELDEFVVRHGYHGPAEGELSATTWRMRRDPLEPLISAYRAMGEERSPRRVEAERGQERARAEAELLGALPRLRRAPARLVLSLAARLIPLRGTGKAAFLQCVDTMRVAARAYGTELAEDGTFERPEDVFMLTLPELLAPVPRADLPELVQQRRAIEADYRTTDVPDLWEGMPERIALTEADTGGAAGTIVTGAAVSPGVITGTARVILDAQEDDPLEPGEILVCRTTDPSWASTLMVASALVIDIGGPISHGAIVARELGIPCVIGTRTGTSAIGNGDTLRVDGGKGEVTIVERAG
ncbi:MAG TPA: PEP-utilizing enzyme [Solirubrobacteraceae bacterium]